MSAKQKKVIDIDWEAIAPLIPKEMFPSTMRAPVNNEITTARNEALSHALQSAARYVVGQKPTGDLLEVERLILGLKLADLHVHGLAGCVFDGWLRELREAPGSVLEAARETLFLQGNKSPDVHLSPEVLEVLAPGRLIEMVGHLGRGFWFELARLVWVCTAQGKHQSYIRLAGGMRVHVLGDNKPLHFEDWAEWFHRLYLEI